ncbi:MAG: hypothetical protein QXD41_02490 [Nitrososphaeria archaeon]
MTKSLLIKILLGILVVAGIGGAVFVISSRRDQQKTSSEGSTESQGKKEISFSEVNVCDLVPEKMIEETIGREIVKVEWVSLKTIKYCSYYTHYIDPQSGGSNIAIGFSNENYEEIKKDLQRPGLDNEFIKDERISIDHYLIKDRVGKVWEVDLFLGNNWFLGIKSNHDAVTGEELIKIALKIIEEIFSSGKRETEEIVPLPQDEDIIRNFVTQIEEGRPDQAAQMMKLKDTSPPQANSELQSWAVQFAAITSFKLLEMEKANESEWTDSKHIYKVVLDVWMDPSSADAPIPYYGWENGENTRWIVLEKVGDVWKIAEIATAP